MSAIKGYRAVAFFLLSNMIVLHVAAQSSDPYAVEYIELRRAESGYHVGDSFVPDDDLESLPAILEPYKSNKVSVGPGSDITMGQLLQLGPVLSGSGYELYTVDESGVFKRVFFL